MPAPFNPSSPSALAAIDTAAGVRCDDRAVVVEGVVSPRSQGGWYGRAGQYDVHAFSFAGWRQVGGGLVARELTLLRPVRPFVEGGNAFDEIPAYSIQRLSVVLTTDHTRAVVGRVLTMDAPDATLLELADQLRAPVVVQTESFGALTLNPGTGRFEGEAVWGGRVVNLRLQPDGQEGIGRAIQTAERLWSGQADWQRRVAAFAVDQLLPLKNESWLDEDESELSPAEFAARMELVSVSIEGNDQFEFWHRDGDLFWGHWIQISGSLKDGLTEANIPG